MTPFTVYDTTTGRVVTTGKAGSFAAAAGQAWGPHLGWLPVTATGRDWVDPSGSTGCQDDTGTFVDLPGIVVPRPGLPRFDGNAVLPDGIDEVVLAGLPEGTTVSVDGGEPQEVTDGEIRFSSTMPGTYRLLVSCWPYLDYEELIVCG